MSFALRKAIEVRTVYCIAIKDRRPCFDMNYLE